MNDMTSPAASQSPSQGGCRLVLVLHNHQPVGNFDSVIEEALELSYRPFLRMLGEFPSVRVVLHTSGCLLDWLVDHAHDYLAELRDAVERGQVELLGGPLDEPILAAIPRRDRVGQIRMHTEKIRQVFGVDVQGMWVPERVWEHGFVGDVTNAGMRYTVLDDSHFRAAGLSDDALSGSYVCEDEGRVFRVFPINERLRYIIPFHPVDEVIDEMRSFADRHPGGLMVFADDGEKFGVWPGTQQSVFEEGWLRQFFERLTQESEWLTTTTLFDVAKNEAPLGRVSLPDTSYREMTEWVLPSERQRALIEQRNERPHSDPGWDQLKDFVRGGTWRNFFAKYPESADMAARMKEVSGRLEHARHEFPEARDELARATRALYRGQCNCSYWHGAFGGLYLSHLRQAVYKHLIEADTILAKLSHRDEDASWVEAEIHDYNFDLRPEVKLSSNRLVAYVAASDYATLYELDVRGCGTNLLATLSRQEEPYHASLLSSLDHDDPSQPHQSVRVKEEGLGEILEYDCGPNRSFVDHFLPSGTSHNSFRRQHALVQASSASECQKTVHREPGRVMCEVSWSQTIETCGNVQVTKVISLAADRPGDLVVHYLIENLPPDAEFDFAVEIHLAGIAANADDRFLYGDMGQRLGPVNIELELASCVRLGAVDEWLGLDVALEWDRPASLWTDPIETVSGSEGGVEKTYQSTRVVPRWSVMPDEQGRWEVCVTFSCDTSAADARRLAHPTAALTGV